MKTITILSALLFGISTICVAQTDNNLDELLSRLDQNHRGSITDVFTVEEIQLLDTYFANVRPQNPTRLKGGGVDLFAPENNVNNSFGHYNSGDPGTYNITGPGGTADFEGAGAYNPVSGTYFVIDDAGNAYEVNPDTGIYTFLGTVEAPNGENVTGLEFNPLDNKMYAISTDGEGSTTVSTINTTTLAVEEVGGTGLTLGIALGIDNAGNGYALDIDVDQMFRINLNDGSATSLGGIGFDSSFGQGMGFDHVNGILYLSAFNNTTFQSELREVDTVSGATSFLGAIGSVVPGGGGIFQFAWTGPQTSQLSVLDNNLSGFDFSPNPVTTALSLSALANIERIEIHNLLGQSVIDEVIHQTNGTLDVSPLPAGIYILTATVDGQQASYQFIKK
ncbi:MAG: T9SS type A sorting domain-containing protein [Flavobacteriaceae bacterium]|nr:T9SS type A sorting domain-containing protein [Flavobacteriaceae bacterium]